MMRAQLAATYRSRFQLLDPIALSAGTGEPTRTRFRHDGIKAHRQKLLRSRLLEVHGVWQQAETGNLIAGNLVDLTPMLGRLGTQSRDFH